MSDQKSDVTSAAKREAATENFGMSPVVAVTSSSGFSISQENRVFFGWFVISQAAMLFLSFAPAVVEFLQPISNYVVSNVFLLSNLNTNYPFNTDLARAHSVVMFMLLPIQIVSFFLIPKAVFAKGAQKKGWKALLVGVLLFSLIGLGILLRGQSIHGPVKLLGTGGFAIATVTYVLTICLSNAVRLFSILISTIRRAESKNA
ncbi:MAG: hypothetical protein IPN64_13875 [Propionivibrio sp.]|uniref:hypothetical protein n=1 Tax=Propionivibrio sp. TaxID=2212460 RepID=UPI0025E96073|nr:hypothetical protein [Propionivibrio sp.]MBK8895071.1 hypothetical protein [Propionivibrio sp.]